MYHGSPYRFSKLELRPHYLVENRPACFASPKMDIAFLFLAQWSGSDLELSFDPETNKVNIYELYPNALESIFKGKSGYVYSVDPKPFVYLSQLWSPERVSFTSPEIWFTHYIPDAYSMIRNNHAFIINAYSSNKPYLIL